MKAKKEIFCVAAKMCRHIVETQINQVSITIIINHYLTFHQNLNL